MNKKEVEAQKNIGKTMTEIVGQDYKNWKPGEGVIFAGSTGSGKTYFIENTLIPYAKLQGKTVLFICNRSSLEEDVREEIRMLGYDNTYVTTYQHIQHNRIHNIDLIDYDYIIYDEVHYLVTEGWNERTDLARDFLRERKDKCVSIYMSGTGKEIFNILLGNNYVKVENQYIIPYSYDYVEQIIFYTENDYIEELIEGLPEDEKLIFICNSADRAYKLYKKYEEKAGFICSLHNQRLGKYSEDCINYLKNEDGTLKYDEISSTEDKKKYIRTFDKQILIATSAIDVGINIYDRRIKHIVTDLVELNSLQQSLGRKRIFDKTDTVKFYIKNHSKESLNRFYHTVNKVYEFAKEYVDDKEKFLKDKENQRHGKLNPCFYTDYTSNSFNDMTFLYYALQKKQLEKCMNDGFDYILINKLGSSVFDKDIIYLDEVEKITEIERLCKYLKQIKGNRIYAGSKEKEQLEEKLKENGFNKRTLGVNTINGWFMDKQLGFKINSARNRIRDENHNKTYWSVEEF